MSQFECDNCGCEIDENATKCPNCGVEFSGDITEVFTCYYCDAVVSNDCIKCPNCGKEFQDKEIKIANIDCTSSDNFSNASSLFAALMTIGVVVFFISIFSSFVFFWLYLVASIVIYIIYKSDYNGKIKRLEEDMEKFLKRNKKKKLFSYVALTLDSKGICINEKEQEIVVFNGSFSEKKCYKFKDILSYELRENGNKEIEGKGLQTFVVGEAFGPNAALATASSTRRINDFCLDLSIVIYSENINDNNTVIDLIKSTKTNKSNYEYKELYDFAKNIIITLEKIMNSKRKNEQKKLDNQKTLDNSKNDKYNELKRLKELLDEKIITKKEFDVEKKKILNKE